MPKVNYYNDNDKFASKWLRELIKGGLIPDGYVDDRSITEITPEDVRRYGQCHFFAGIAGWPRALELAGWDSTRSVWTASLPCQPFSCAGQQQGEKDERQLWPTFFALVKECRPPVIFGEQVASKDGSEWLAGIQADLETLGYSTAAADLPAASVGSPHKRNRLFWVAQSGKQGLEGHREIETQDTGKEGCFCRKVGSTGQTSPTGRVPDSKRHGRRSNEPGWQEKERAANFWSNSAFIQCADQKARRVPGRVAYTDENGRWRPRPQRNMVNEPNESALRGVGQRDSTGREGDSGGRVEGRHFEIEPALFPLADGLPNRVGILRGAGNSIVPQVAAEFIAAVMEI